MGPVLLSGVHMTNLIGVAILGFASSQIFHIYYFQVNVWSLELIFLFWLEMC